MKQVTHAWRVVSDTFMTAIFVASQKGLYTYFFRRLLRPLYCGVGIGHAGGVFSSVSRSRESRSYDKVSMVEGRVLGTI